MHKILIIEDDEIIAKSIEKEISNWGFTAKRITDFQDIIPQFVEFDPQLVLLDITLPFFNGYHWCTEIRKLSKVPIVFISSASDNMNIVMAMNMGGDDFIAKPFDLHVLIAKIQAILRRTYDFSTQSNLLEHNGAILNINDNSISYKGEKVELTKNEYKILQTLLENKGKTVSRDNLMIKLWETDNYVEENTLNVNITRLRRKLEAIGLKNFIKTKKGLGYIIN
ncbi:response regulator transcription factor [Intestinibacter sp.]|uniref:response regulator transcription factor n=1 Tax=Intestinibacter sp. TaxID=1965304 RepID=UPI002A750C00|nr:response regulator transcription factor [Intestinibacter sp.]MDY2735407.1 response regulator transcription factor [Intestinibacter sp.]MDY4575328.1 response regulator transcription factor [Intestinibacter sp.]